MFLMTDGEGKRWLIAASVLGVLGLAHTPARAADVGGDCCADLEERVAELEATTARKGNKKVTVEVYGKVNRALLFWDDGAEQNVYSVENGYNTDRFGIRGKAKINGDWSGGYRMEWEHRFAFSRLVNQIDDDNVENGTELLTRHSYIFLNHKKYGEVRLGLTQSPYDNINKDTMVYGNVIDTVTQDFFMNQGFFLRPKGFDTEVGPPDLRFIDINRCYTSAAVFDCSTRRNMVVYESPKVLGSKDGNGLWANWGWGEDDIWSASLRYKDEWGENFKVGAGIGYEDFRDERLQAGGGGLAGFQRDIKEWGASASILHTPTGLFVTGAYSTSENDDTNRINAGVFTGTSSPDMDAWDVQGGVHKKFLDLGLSTFLVGYTNGQDGVGGAGGPTRLIAANRLPGVGIATEITGSETDKWYFVYDQEVVPGALNLYIAYQHITPEIDLVDSGLAPVNVPLDDFDLVYTGARIYF